MANAPEPTENSPMKSLQNLLAMLDFPTDIIEKSEEIHFETILVVLDEEPSLDEPPELVAQMFFVEDILTTDELVEFVADFDTYTLQFIVELPVDWSELSGLELLKGLELLGACSKIIPVGYLGLNENQNIYFNYAFKVANQTPSVSLVVDILNQAQYFLTRMQPSLEKAKSKDSTLAALIEAVEVAITQEEVAKA